VAVAEEAEEEGEEKEEEEGTHVPRSSHPTGDIVYTLDVIPGTSTPFLRH
jgi:hypothetical protein